ncbi:hypothetical protein VQH23_10290 [Pararoseomonas sp. SCSIO 73927]|uniref:hypothetical protein n=1 Tax=Pararoseomonas sp. SCSIO 73927 TaxID=3114537 RepID=UPI0030CC8ABF
MECLTPGAAVPTVLVLLVVWGASGWCFPAVQQARLVALSPALAPVLPPSTPPPPMSAPRSAPSSAGW